MRPTIPRCACVHAELLPALRSQSLDSALQVIACHLGTCEVSLCLHLGSNKVPRHVQHGAVLFQSGPFDHAGERLAAHHHGGGASLPSKLQEVGAIKLGERLPMPNSGRYWKVTAAGQAYMEEHKRRWAWFGRSRQPWEDFMRLEVRQLPPGTCSLVHAAWAIPASAVA